MISSNAKKLIIYIHTTHVQIDFTKLSHKMSVQIISTENNNIVHFSGNDIRQYVSELTIENYTAIGFNIRDTILTVDKLNLIMSKFGALSLNASFTYLTADLFSLNTLNSNIYSNANVEQISLVLNDYSSSVNYKIEYGNSEWSLYNNTSTVSLLKLSYQYSSKFGIIAISNKFEFCVASSSVTTTKPVNITLLNYYSVLNSYPSANILENYKFPVKIITSGGYWDNLNGKAEVYFCSYEDHVELDASQCNSQYVNIIRKPIENPSIPSGFPYPSPSQTPTASPSRTPTQTPLPPYTISYLNDGTAYLHAYGSKWGSEFLIDEALESISETTDKLIITLHCSDVKADFTKLPKKISVLVNSTSPSFYFLLSGKNCTNYVSELTIKGLPKNGIRIIDLLILENLKVIDCAFFTSSVYLYFKHFTADSFSLSSALKTYGQRLKAEQVSLILNNYSPSITHQVSFNNSGWAVYNSSSSYQMVYVPYEKISKFEIIGLSNEYDLFVASSSITTAKPVNITLLNLDTELNFDSSASILENSKFPVRIISTGYWENINETTDIYFNSYEDYVELNIDGLNQTLVNLIRQPIENTSIPVDGPYPTAPPIQPSKSPSCSPSQSPFATPTQSLAQTAYPSKTPRPTYTPTRTPNPTWTPMETFMTSETPSETPSLSQTPLPTETPTESPTPSLTDTPIPSQSPSESPSQSPPKTPAPEPTQSPTASPVPCDVANCSMCLIANICSQCDESYDLVNEKCILHATRIDLCFENVPGCSICQQGEYNKCNKCNTTDHWEINGEICSCEEGYDHVGNNCILHSTRTDLCYDNIIGCLTCEPGSDNICNECAKGFYSSDISNGSFVCSPCRIGCNECSSFDQCNSNCKKGYLGISCTECESNYYQQTSSTNEITCTMCPINCETCENASVCNTCKIGFVGTNCDSCEQGYWGEYINNNLISCTQCAVNCIVCSSSSQCGTCAEGYEGSDCQRCAQGYVKENGLCVPRIVSCEDYGIYHCNNCDIDGNKPFCTSCYIGYEGDNCGRCSNGYYMKSYVSGAITCTSCGIGCSTCKTSKTCDKFKDHFISKDACEVGYFIHDFNNGTIICDKCSENCASCLPDGTCLSCKEGYHNPENQCESCESGFYRDTSTENIRCLSCQTNCHECISSTQCTSCKTGYINSETNSICNICDESNGYVVVSTSNSIPVCRHQCEADIDCSQNFVCKSNKCVCSTGYTGENCQECATGYIKSDSGKCNACDIGYFKQEDESCSPCGNNSNNCSSNTVCNECKQGYILTAEFTCTLQNTVAETYEDPNLKYLDSEILDNVCLDKNGKLTFDEKVYESIISSGENLNENVLRVDLEETITSIELSSSSVGVFLDLTDAKIGSSIDLSVSESHRTSSLKFNDNSEVVLNIKSNNSSNINIIGGKQVTFNAPTNYDQPTVMVGSISPIKNSNSNDPFIIESNIPVVVDSIDLYGSLSIKASENTKVVVNNVAVKQAATTKIDNIQINNVLEIGEDSQIKFENNSTFDENAKIVVNFRSSSKAEFASIIGKLPAKPPQVFNMKLIRNIKSLGDSPKFLLAQSEDSDFLCSEWQRKCSSSIGQSDEFNDCQCSSSNNNKVPLLYATVKNKSSLSGGAIAGIVIACVAVFAVIAIYTCLFPCFEEEK